jgi:MFS family permease
MYNDHFGRKQTLLMGCLITITGNALLIASPNVAALMIGRILMGASAGFLNNGVAMYCSEVAQRTTRGTANNVQFLFGQAITIAASGVNYAISGLPITVNWGWRLACSIIFVPMVTMGVSIMLFCPESPRWLIMKHRYDEALDVLVKIRSDGEKTPDVMLEYNEMKAAVIYEQEHNETSWFNFIKNKGAIKRTLIAMSSSLWWIFNGGAIFSYYFTNVYAGAGITDTRTQYLLNLMNTLLAFVATCIGTWGIDKWGRRAAGITATAVAAVSLTIMCAISVKFLDGQETPSRAAGIAFIFMYNFETFVWQATWNTIGMLYGAEIWAPSLRARGFSLGCTTGMVAGFVSSYTALPTYDRLHGYTWLLYGGFCALACFQVWATWPETLGKNLEEIELYFDTGAAQQIRKVMEHDNIEREENADDKIEVNVEKNTTDAY